MTRFSTYRSVATLPPSTSGDARQKRPEEPSRRHWLSAEEPGPGIGQRRPQVVESRRRTVARPKISLIFDWRIIRFWQQSTRCVLRASKHINFDFGTLARTLLVEHTALPWPP